MPPYLMGAPFPSRLIINPGPSGLQFLLPRIADVTVSGGHIVWSCPNSSSQSVVMPGSASVTYNVDIRIVGVVETAKYIGGTTTSTFFNTNGTADGSHPSQNTYKITTSNPVDTYWLNASWSGSGFPSVVAIDYNKTIPVVGGATISLIANAGDSLEERQFITVPDISDPPQPYLGQWIDVFILSIH